MLGLNIGIDLGTATVVICEENKGIVLSEPSVVAYRRSSGRMIAVGTAAYEMIGREPKSIRIVRPLRDGVISDYTVTEQMLRTFIRKICGNEIFKPNIVMSMPGTVTNLQKRTMLDAITASGAGKACLLEEPLAAAIGAGIDTSHPNGIMVVDLGGGTTDVAVITMGSMAVVSSIRSAGNALSESIMKYCRRERSVLIGELTAEEIKKKIGCAYQRREEVAMIVKGKDYISGMPVEFEITSNEVYLAMREHLRIIINTICDVLEQTPPELAVDIMTDGIVLTGGTAQLYGLDRIVQEATGVPTRVAEDPVNCVAKGIETTLGELDQLEASGYLFVSRADISGVTGEPGEDY